MDLKHVHVDDGAGNNYDLVEVDGVVFPSYFADDPVQRLTDVRQMEGRDDDVVIIAYPKAGGYFLTVKNKKECRCFLFLSMQIYNKVG